MSKKKILLIDDDLKFASSVKLILDGAGYEVELACDGKEGGMKLAECRPDLIILDVMMPNKDGFQLCAEIKKDPRLESIPVIMLTAVGENIPRTKYAVSDGFNLEAEDYIPKPVEPAVLIGRIKALIP